MSTCRNCVALVPDPPCPNDFAVGTVIVPIPTRQRVCNTEQIASCPDGSNPQIVAAGTFCTTVLNPTTASIATAQAAVDAQALAQAQSQVGDCAWNDVVWTIDPNINFSGPGDPLLITTAGSGLEGNAQVSAIAPLVVVGAARGCKATGDITFNYKTGTVTHHNISGSFDNQNSPAGGAGVFGCSVDISSGVNFGALVSIFSASYSGLAAIGVIPFSHDFTSDGATPKVYRITLQTTTYSETTHTHNQTATVNVKALD